MFRQASRVARQRIWSQASSFCLRRQVRIMRREHLYNVKEVYTASAHVLHEVPSPNLHFYDPHHGRPGSASEPGRLRLLPVNEHGARSAFIDRVGETCR